MEVIVCIRVRDDIYSGYYVQAREFMINCKAVLKKKREKERKEEIYYFIVNG